MAETKIGDNAKFTPGPWSVREQIWYHDTPMIPIHGIAHDKPICVGRVIRKGWDSPCNQPEASEANAHLIAAAPDLYAALAQLCEYYGVTSVIPVSADAKVWHAALTALAKARGAA